MRWLIITMAGILFGELYMLCYLMYIFHKKKLHYHQEKWINYGTYKFLYQKSSLHPLENSGFLNPLKKSLLHLAFQVLIYLVWLGFLSKTRTVPGEFQLKSKFNWTFNFATELMNFLGKITIGKTASACIDLNNKFC